MNSTKPESLTSEEVEELLDAADCSKVTEEYIQLLPSGVRIHEINHIEE